MKKIRTKSRDILKLLTKKVVASIVVSRTNSRKGVLTKPMRPSTEAIDI